MKKLSKILLLFILTIPFIVSAKDCTIISGTGKNIGDEVACGTEHFYVISNDGTNAKLLAKYNLLAGYGYQKITLNNYTTDNLDEIYLIDTVKKRLDEGFFIYDVDYDEDPETGIFTVFEIFMQEDYNVQNKVHWLDTPTIDLEEIITSETMKKYMNDGFGVSREIVIDDKIVGIELFKHSHYDTKTIFIDNVEFRNEIELYNISQIKELIDAGYIIGKSFYNEKKCSAEDCKYDYFTVQLYKDANYDFSTTMFDEPITETEYNEYTSNNQNYANKLNQGYNSSAIVNSYKGETNTIYHYYGVIFTKRVENTKFIELLQNPKAIGINGSVESPNYPFHGIINTNQELIQIVYEEEFHIGAPYGNGNFQDLNFEVLSYFENYKETLEKKGYTIKTIDMLKVSELSDIIEEITGEPIPLEDWYNNKTYIEKTESYKLGNLKELIADKHPWLYSTTYWLGTLDPDYYTSLYDINTMGDLCSTSICRNDPTTGIRPLITMASENIKYGITTKINGEGTLTASHETANPDHEITFEVKPAEGYVLSEVKVTDEDGNVITFTDYKFTMPSANVTIEATFVPYNPDTADRNIIIAVILIIVGTLVIITSNKKVSWLK